MRISGSKTCSEPAVLHYTGLDGRVRIVGAIAFCLPRQQSPHKVLGWRNSNMAIPP